MRSIQKLAVAIVAGVTILGTGCKSWTTTPPQPPPLSTNIVRHVSVVVDERIPIAVMVEAGGYDHVNDGITDGSFPICSCAYEAEEPRQEDLLFVQFAGEATSKQALESLDKAGLRPATLHELLAFGTTYPELWKGVTFVALGSVNTDGGYVPYLYTKDTRSIFLHGLGWAWNACDIFLAVKK